MHPTFFDDSPIDFDVPPLPLNDEPIGLNFANFAMQTQKKENLFHYQKNKNDILPPQAEIVYHNPKSTRPPPINPVLIRSPRIRDDDPDSGRLILSTGESYIGPSGLANRISKGKQSDYSIEPPRSIRSPNTEKFESEKSEIPDALFAPVKMDGAVTDVPIPTPTPVRLAQNFRVNTACEEFEQAKKRWAKMIEIEEQKNKEKIQSLIQNHVNELRIFDEKYGKLPRAVSAVPVTLELRPNGRNRALARVPALISPYTTHQRILRKPSITPRQQETSNRRKQIIARQQAEIIDANDECNTRILALKAQMKYDLEKRAKQLSLLVGKDIDTNCSIDLMPKSPHEIPKDGPPFHLKVKKVQANRRF